MNYISHIIYFSLYFFSLSLDTMITQSVLNQKKIDEHTLSTVSMSKYILTFTKFLLIMEMGYYSGFYFINTISSRAQIKITRIFSFVFSIFIGYLYEFSVELKILLILHCIVFVFLLIRMRENTDVIYHTYNKKIGLDLFKINLYIVEEMIDSCKKAGMIWVYLLIMADLFSPGKNPFHFFHLTKLIFLWFDFILKNSQMSKKNFYKWSYILMGTIWLLGIIILIPLLVIYGLVKTSILFVIESCFTTIVILSLYRMYLIKKIEGHRNYTDGS